MNLSEGHDFLAARPFSYVYFLFFFYSFPFICLLQYYVEFFFSSRNGGVAGDVPAPPPYLPPNVYSPDISNDLSEMK